MRGGGGEGGQKERDHFYGNKNEMILSEAEAER